MQSATLHLTGRADTSPAPEQHPVDLTGTRYTLPSKYPGTPGAFRKSRRY